MNQWLTPGNILTFLGFLVASGLAYWQIRRTSQTKRVEYELSSSGNLFTLDHRIANRVQVTFDGVPVPDLKVHTLRFIHTGNKAIEPEDWNRVLLIEYPETAKILNAKVVDQSANLTVNTAFDDRCVTVDSILLNPRESFKLSIVLSGGGRPEIGCRIVDGQPVREYIPGGKVEAIFSGISPLVLFLMLIALMVKMVLPLFEKSTYDGIIFIVMLVGVAVVMYMLHWVDDKRYRNERLKEREREIEEFPD